MVVADWYQYPTNYSNGTTIEGPGQLFLKYPGFIMNDWLGTGILGMMFLFTFMITMSSGSRKALLTSGFITFIFSVWFARLGMVNPLICMLLIVLTIIGAIGSQSEQSL